MGFPNLRAERVVVSILVQKWPRFFFIGVFISDQGVVVHLQAVFHDGSARTFHFLLISQ